MREQSKTQNSSSAATHQVYYSPEALNGSIMLVKIRLVFLLPLAALLACGSNGPLVSAVPTYTFSGDWGATSTFVSLSIPIAGFFGSLSASGGTVSGTLVPITNASCGAASTGIAVSGSVDASGNLTVTLPVGGGTASLNATLAANPQTLVGGSYQIVGGTCAMSVTPMTIAEYAPLDGTYTGTFNILTTPTSGTATNVTAVLTQSITPNANGMFPVTGTVTTSGACTASFTLSNSVVWGGFLTASDSSGYYVVVGSFNPAGTTAQLAVFANKNATTGCPSWEFAGALTRQ
jgi:hypothetical protein